ncbi:MAG: NAD-dependent epimerase/dehydratase family protein [Clostridia bacterium]|nr:NAD-dependent epimerase/dehydratase family protein [Clostridia bacterium]
MLYDNALYTEDIKNIAGLQLPWNKLSEKSIIISGASGMIGSFLIDVILEKNAIDNLNCTIYAIGRNEEKLRKRFVKYLNDKHLVFLQCDIQEPLKCTEICNVDYVLHLASNTHPLLYSTDPIGTILTNIIGVKNMLDFAIEHNAIRFAFASSNEMYGENRGDVELFDENYCGYINCNTLRAGYPESKRCGEALCQAYKTQKGLDIVIPRLTRTYGPTMSMSDTKAASQFIKKGVNGENIVLKSAGTQFYSYTYVADAVGGLLTSILNGVNGEAYNIADVSGDTTIKNLANLIANIAGTEVVFEIPDVVEAAGYSRATKARLDGNKLRALGWTPLYDINDGVERTIKILKSLKD